MSCLKISFLTCFGLLVVSVMLPECIVFVLFENSGNCSIAQVVEANCLDFLIATPRNIERSNQKKVLRLNFCDRRALIGEAGEY